MKKTMASLIFSALLVASVGITAQASEVSSAAAESAATSSAATSVAATSASTSAATSTAETTAAPAGLSGIFTAYDEERYPDDRAPAIELSESGGFVFYLNLGDGRLAVLTGTYVGSGSSINLDVMYADSTDYLGEGTENLSFTQEGGNTLVYQGDPLGMTRSGDTFELEGASGGSGMLGQNVYILAAGEVVELTGE